MEYTEQYLENYCLDKLSSDEAIDFERNLKADKKLQEEIRKMLLTLHSLRGVRAEKLKTRLMNAESNTLIRRINTTSTWIRWAAAIVVLIISTYFILNKTLTYDHSEIYATYFEPYPNVIEPTTRGAAGNNNTDAFNLYESGRYNEAFQAFQELYRQNPQDFEIRFYYGLSAMLIAEYETAYKELEAVAGSDSRFINQATWYLALLEIKTDHPAKADQRLKALIESKSSYSEKAKKIRRLL